MTRPKLRFPGFEGDWAEKRMSEIFSFHQTNSYSRALMNREHGRVKNIHYGDIHTKFKSGFILEKEDVPFLNLDVDIKKIKEDQYCKVGDLIIADASEDYQDIGKAIEIISTNNEKLLSGLHTYIARPNNGAMATGFLGFLMQTFLIRLQIMKYATGVSVLGITKTNLNKLIFPLPLHTEQQKIANSLTTIDKKITHLTQKKEALTQYKKGMMQKLFPKDGETVPELRFPGFEGVWVEKCLGEISKKVNKKNNEEKLKLVLTNSAVQGIVNQTDYFDKEIANQGNLQGYYSVSINDFIYNPRVSVSAPVGPIKRNNLTLGVMSPLYLVFRFNKECNLNYLEQYFNANFWNGYMKSISNIGARHDRMNISNSDFFKLPIPYPSLLEQQKITEFLTDIDDRITQADHQIKKMTQFKKGLLQQMFV
jgi:type I restriction enzyme, S subunit